MTTHAGTKRADEVTELIPPDAWVRLSAGKGPKGTAGTPGRSSTSCPSPTVPTSGPSHYTLLVRGNDTPGEPAWYRCWTPRPVPVRNLGHVAGRRWTVEENFQAAKGQAGLDEHQVRRWNYWHRWTTMAMLAHTFLTVPAAVMNVAGPTTDEAGLITVTRPKRAACSPRSWPAPPRPPNRSSFGPTGTEPAPPTTAVA